MIRQALGSPGPVFTNNLIQEFRSLIQIRFSPAKVGQNVGSLAKLSRSIMKIIVKGQIVIIIFKKPYLNVCGIYRDF